MLRETVRRRLGRRPSLMLLGALVAGCAAAPHPEPSPEAQGRTYALLLNGGGRPAINYRSHLQHVRTLVQILRESGVPASRMWVFGSDGADPGADLATKSTFDNPAAWLLPEATVGGALSPGAVFVNSEVQGMELRPARKEALAAWFEEEGALLRRGDSLLLYVTDHGERANDKADENTITLWNESLSVTELRAFLDRLDPGVRVVMLMSQCFSGAFAGLALAADGQPRTDGNVCGYFASSADRPAYGCYPENRGKDGVGHSFHFFEALDSVGLLSEAHNRVLVTDDSPDVPHSAADFFLAETIRRAAEQANADVVGFTDDLLTEAWRDRGRWEPEIRLLDRIGQRFGFFSPRSLAETEEQRKGLEQLGKELRIYGDRWLGSLEALRQENLRRFLEKYPDWQSRLEAQRLRELSEVARREMAEDLLAELSPFTVGAAERFARLQALHAKTERARAASYRSEVRLGVLLRMRTILTSIAGRVLLTQPGYEAERAGLQRLVECAAFPVGPGARLASAAELPLPDPFPRLAEERETVRSVMPAWMGVYYRPLSPDQQEQYGVPAGAVLLSNVYPESPALTAGLETGDIVLGPPDAPFEEPHAIREWTMAREIGAAERLEILRGEERREVVLRPAAFPLKLPKLPGPPEIGTKAQKVDVEVVRGMEPRLDGRPRLLFFWATWCVICHAAVPEVLAFAASRGVDVLAISDEDGAVVRKFLESASEPFPEVVGVDPRRRTFQRYAVSGTPTFVLIDPEGIVQHYQAGYDARRGLSIEGWQWQRETSSAEPSTGGE